MYLNASESSKDAARNESHSAHILDNYLRGKKKTIHVDPWSSGYAEKHRR